MDLRLDDPGPRIRDLAYLLCLEELLGGERVERWAGERGKLDALREWRKVARPRIARGPPADRIPYSLHNFSVDREARFMRLDS